MGPVFGFLGDISAIEMVVIAVATLLLFVKPVPTCGCRFKLIKDNLASDSQVSGRPGQE
jgi:hypothetical protein